MGPARPTPARALTPRPRWDRTPADTTTLPQQPESRTNSRRANAAASQPSIHLPRATGAPPSRPRLVSRFGGEREVQTEPPPPRPRSLSLFVLFVFGGLWGFGVYGEFVGLEERGGRSRPRGVNPTGRALKSPPLFLLLAPFVSLVGIHACPFRWSGSRGSGGCLWRCGVVCRPGRVGVVVVDDGGGRCPEIRTWFVCAASSLVPRQGFLMSDRWWIGFTISDGLALWLSVDGCEPFVD